MAWRASGVLSAGYGKGHWRGGDPTVIMCGGAPESRLHLPAQWDRPPGSKVDNPIAHHIPKPSGSRLQAFAFDAVAKAAAAAKHAAKHAAKPAAKVAAA